MSTATTEDRVIHLLSRMLGQPPEQLRPDVDLVADLGIGSVDLLGLVAGIEEEFDIVFPGDASAINQVRTIRELVALVEEYQG
ncbi:MAG: acyl carrier protein [Gemmatimonadota bacterium]|nr:acyl carrier protein [Gemmatimonadota bacterium]